jgi:hypothetical protein
MGCELSEESEKRVSLMSYLDIAKKAKEDFRKGQSQPEPVVADPTEGRIIAVKINSQVLAADIWFALDDSFNPGDGLAVFYADELEFLKNKDTRTLRKIHETKVAFGPGSRMRQ